WGSAHWPTPPTLGRVQLETLERETVVGHVVVDGPPTVAQPRPPYRPWYRTRAAYRFGALTMLLATLFVIMVVVHPTRQSLAGALDPQNVFAPLVAVGAAAVLTTALAPRTVLAGV